MMKLYFILGLLPQFVNSFFFLPKTVKKIGKAAFPVVGFYGLMTLPIYGKNFLPGTGTMLDFELLRERQSPNEYLIAPKSSCPQFNGSTPLDDGQPRREEAPVFPVGVDELQSIFIESFKRRYALESFAEPTLVNKTKRQYVYVERTPLLRFPDIINVQFISLDENRSTLVIHSGSVFGYSDLGKNKQRLTEIISSLSNIPWTLKRATVQV
mmetsp:Transcript_714/g.899  ORF Transcript_714/g.899 Transcript_714/m.899 type:complete len:211 (-) Transcript_714:31-663(-)